MAHVLGRDADAGLGVGEAAAEPLLLFLEPQHSLGVLVSELALCRGSAWRTLTGDRGGKPIGLAAANAAGGERPLQRQPQHLTRGAELLSNNLCLEHQGVQHAVLLALLVDKVAAGHDRRWLQLAVDAAVALLKPRGVPRQVDMHEVVAARLQVQALARRVGADEEAHRLLLEGCVEGDLDAVALVQAGLPGENPDASVEVDLRAAAQQAFLQPVD